jgi:hypothetical protein
MQHMIDEEKMKTLQYKLRVFYKNDYEEFVKTLTMTETNQLINWLTMESQRMTEEANLIRQTRAQMLEDRLQVTFNTEAPAPQNNEMPQI